MAFVIKKDMVLLLASVINSYDEFQVWIAESGTYGHYSDNDGNTVVSFSVENIFEGYLFSGNYITNNSGTGWRINKKEYYNPPTLEELNAFLDAKPFNGALNKLDLKTWRKATIEEEHDRHKGSNFVKFEDFYNEVEIKEALDYYHEIKV